MTALKTYAKDLAAARERAIREMEEVQVGIDNMNRAISLKKYLEDFNLPPFVVKYLLMQAGHAYDQEMRAEWERLFNPIPLQHRHAWLWPKVKEGLKVSAQMVGILLVFLGAVEIVERIQGGN